MSDSPQRPLRLALVLHLNQNLVPYADLASAVCYHPFLDLVEKHPSLPLTMHVSGTLLAWAVWHDPPLVKKLQKLVAGGRLSLLGSTYAQNMLLCATPWQNDNAVQQHEAFLKALFPELHGRPRGFWNPEKSWSHENIAFIASQGYDYAFVEEHVLKAAGVKKGLHEPRYGVHGESRLPLFTDSASFTEEVNTLVKKYSSRKFERFLQDRLKEAVRYPDSVFCYCEDMEASGLWQYEEGREPASVLAGWDQFLTDLESSDVVELVRPADLLPEVSTENPLAKSGQAQARWMEKAFSNRKARWHQKGYKDWFDYIVNSEDIAYCRQLFEGLEKEIQKKEALLAREEGLPERDGMLRLLAQARLSLAIHQYEFGLTGMRFSGYSSWDLARSLMVYLYSIDYLAEAQAFSAMVDVNADGIPEVVIFNGRHLWVLSREGGRLLYWIDAAAGLQLVGAEHPSFSGELFENDGKRPLLAGARDLWQWVRHDHDHPVWEKQYKLRQRALNEHLYIVSREADADSASDAAERVVPLAGRELDCRLAGNGAVFSLEEEDFSFSKSIVLHDDGLSVYYSLEFAKSSSFRLVVENSFSPDLPRLMVTGKEGLALQKKALKSPAAWLRLASKPPGKWDSSWESFAGAFRTEFSRSAVTKAEIEVHIAALPPGES